MTTIVDDIRAGLRYQSAGEFQKAERIYRNVLSVDPNHADCLHFLGALMHQTGRQEAAAELLEKALARNPRIPEAHGNMGLVLKELGRLPEAVRSFERAIALKPEMVSAHYNLGTVYAAMGQRENAVAQFRRALALNPRLPEAHIYLGTIYAGTNQRAEAIVCYRQAIALRPQHAESHFNLGIVLEAEGKLAEAEECYKKAAELNPELLAAQINLGNLLNRRGDLEGAALRYERAVTLKPDFAELYYNLGNLRFAQNRFPDALRRYQRAFELKPDYAQAQLGLGNTLVALGNPQEAVTILRRAVEALPGSGEAHQALANALLQLGLVDEALEHSRQAVELLPNDAKGHAQLATFLGLVDRTEEALRHYQRALELDPNVAEWHRSFGAMLARDGQTDAAIAQYEQAVALEPDAVIHRIGLCMSQLAIAYRTEAEIDQRRAAYAAQLHQLASLAETEAGLKSLIPGLGSAQPFFLAYQGRNDRDLQRLYGSVVCAAMGARFPAVALADPPGPGEPVRVGIVSGYFSLHSNWKIPIKGWLSQLDRGRFRVFGYYTGAKVDTATQEASALCERFVQGPLSVERWREEILKDAPHVLIYPEVGMDTVSVQLAAQRLARVQCNSWGHPDTSGFPTLDYYLSSALMEPADGDEHYSERLVRLPNLSIYYEPTSSVQLPMSRVQLGLRAGATVYWCGQSLFKYLPQYDEVFARIALEAGDCQFLFIEYERGAAVTTLFRERLGRAFGAVGLSAERYCAFVPRLDNVQFQAAFGECDIVLDSIGWSGCNSTLESLPHDLPIVTLRGELMRGRHTAAILEMMGVTETIADTLDAYVATAARLARDPAWRKAIGAKIAANQHRLYRDRAPITALEDFLDKAAREGTSVEGDGDWHLAEALRLIRAGQTADAEKHCRAALAEDPDCVVALRQLAMIAFGRGDLEHAAAYAARVVALDPQLAEGHAEYALALHGLGKQDAAIEHYVRAVTLKPDFGEAYNNLGNVHLARRNFEEAVRCYERAVALQPDSVGLLTNLAIALAHQGKYAAATPYCERAAALDPEAAETQNNLGRAYFECGRIDDAAARFRRVLKFHPDNFEAHLRLGNIEFVRKDFDEAKIHYEKALAIRPDHAEVLYNLAVVAFGDGRRDEAIGFYQRALALQPHHAAANLGLCISQLPILYADSEEIDRRRAEYEAQLRRLRSLVAAPDALLSLSAGIGASQPFFLAYQGRNDRDLQRLYGSVVCAAMGARFPAVALADPPGPGEPVRVGIVSGYFSLHSNWKIPIKGWLSQLDRGRFRVFGYYTGAKVDTATQEASALCERFVQGPLSVERWREEILKDAPHVLIYPEVGMDTVSVQLAAQRLARVQCNSWGHPDTSGFPTLDYYLSSALMEPADGDEHYSERLVRLPNLSIYYEPTSSVQLPMSRVQLGLRAGATVYWCGQSLFKYLPQYDEVFARIALEAGDCQFLFIEYERGAAVTTLFRERLGRAFGAVGLSAERYCAFVPRLDNVQFQAAFGECDIVLDSIGWSGCNSTLESLPHDLPIVTLRGELMRGRHTAAILEMMGVTETIADTLDAYVATAARLARDPAWRKAIGAKIAANQHRLYRDRAPIAALEEFLDKAAREGRA
jgi:predicted O-linked N-acetylglucosamine transferase (SPINDLY family)